MPAPPGGDVAAWKLSLGGRGGGKLLLPALLADQLRRSRSPGSSLLPNRGLGCAILVACAGWWPCVVLGWACGWGGWGVSGQKERLGCGESAHTYVNVGVDHARGHLYLVLRVCKGRERGGNDIRAVGRPYGAGPHKWRRHAMWWVPPHNGLVQGAGSDTMATQPSSWERKETRSNASFPCLAPCPGPWRAIPTAHPAPRPPQPIPPIPAPFSPTHRHCVPAHGQPNKTKRTKPEEAQQ